MSSSTMQGPSSCQVGPLPCSSWPSGAASCRRVPIDGTLHTAGARQHNTPQGQESITQQLTCGCKCLQQLDETACNLQWFHCSTVDCVVSLCNYDPVPSFWSKQLAQYNCWRTLCSCCNGRVPVALGRLLQHHATVPLRAGPSRAHGAPALPELCPFW